MTFKWVFIDISEVNLACDNLLVKQFTVNDVAIQLDFISVKAVKPKALSYIYVAVSLLKQLFLQPFELTYCTL